MTIESFSDGSGQNAKGYGSASFIIVKDKYIIYQETIPLTGCTNNQAEYAALTQAATWLVKGGYKEFTCYVDSELVAKQVAGTYQVTSIPLISALQTFRDIIGHHTCRVEWVPRTNKYIQIADKMNRAQVRKMMI